MGPTEKTPTPRSIICHFPSSQGLSSVVWKHTHVPLLTAVWPRPSAGDNKSCSAWWLSSCHDPTGRGRGDVPSIIYSQWLCKHSVKPGMKWCSLFEIRAQGLWTEDAVTVEFANKGSSPFVPHVFICFLPSNLTPSPLLTPSPPHSHLVYRGWEEWAVSPSLFRSLPFRMNYSGSGNNCSSQLWIHLPRWLSDLMAASGGGGEFPRATLH